MVRITVANKIAAPLEVAGIKKIDFLTMIVSPLAWTVAGEAP